MQIGTMNLNIWVAIGLLLLAIISFTLVLVWLDRQNDTKWARWYERIDKFPSTKGLILLGMFCFVTTGLTVAGNVIFFAWTSKTPSPEFVHALDTWLDKVLILMTIATGHFIGKRATTKVELEAPEEKSDGKGNG